MAQQDHSDSLLVFSLSIEYFAGAYFGSLENMNLKPAILCFSLLGCGESVPEYERTYVNTLINEAVRAMLGQ